MKRLLVRIVGSAAIAAIFGIVGWLTQEPSQPQPFEEAT